MNLLMSWSLAGLDIICGISLLVCSGTCGLPSVSSPLGSSQFYLLSVAKLNLKEDMHLPA